MPLFTPQYIFRDVTRITPEFLQEQGICALVLDVDNTLTEPDSQELHQAVVDWLDTMRKNGIQLMIASNNVEKRVGPFAKNLGLEYTSFCCKPSPLWLLAAKRKWRLHRCQFAIVGDQIFTDALAGHLYGVKVFLVRPMRKDTSSQLRLKRKLEAPFLMKYYKNGGKLL